MGKKYFVNLPFSGVLSEAEIGEAATMGAPEAVSCDSITIEGEEYARMYSDAQDFAELLTALQPMRVYRLGDRLIYRTKDGQLRTCFIDNLFKSWPL